MAEVEEESDYKGYWFCIGDILSIIVCWMLCGLGSVSEIYDWATAKPVRAFLAEQLSVAEIPCKAQFYNILGRVNADALHCSKKSAQAVVDAGADYLFVVKDNQPNLRENIELFVRDEPLEKAVTKEKNAGRIETRTAYISRDIGWLESRGDWAKLACIGAIHTQFEKDGYKSGNWHYYISSATLSAEDLLNHARLEWAIESMHWLLDVHFDEDKTRICDMGVQKSLNILRKIVLNLAKQFKSRLGLRTSIAGILRRNLFDPNYFIAFLSCFGEN
jgi:predicted transposase YbfD/YdcC